MSPFIPLLMSCLSTRPRIYAFAHSVALVGIAIIIDRCIRFPSGKLGRALNSRGFVYLGGPSYALYLWQQPFLDRHVTAQWASSP